jgi:hypothetical protein
LVKRKVFLRIIGLSVIPICIIFYIIFSLLNTPANSTLQTQSGNNQKNEIDISSPGKVFLFEQLPKEGQVIIPKGFYFQIMTNMRGNARVFKSQDTLEDIVNFSIGVAKDRANLLGKKSKDFTTVIWENSDERYKKDIVTLKVYPYNNTNRKYCSSNDFV